MKLSNKLRKEKKLHKAGFGCEKFKKKYTHSAMSTGYRYLAFLNEGCNFLVRYHTQTVNSMMKASINLCPMSSRSVFSLTEGIAFYFCP